MPKFTGSQRLFAELKLGDGKPILLAATSGGTAKKPTITLYVDTNGDRSLADEKPLVASAVGSHDSQFEGQLVTPPVTVPVVYDLPGGQTTRSLTFRLAVPPRLGMAPFVMLLADSVMGGTIKVGGREVAVRLLDMNGDGKITVVNTMQEPPDMVWLSLTPDKPAAGDEVPLLQYVEVAGKFYSLVPRCDGAEITVTPYDGPLGRMTFAAADAEGKAQEISLVELASPTAMVQRKGEPGEIVLPPGKYALNYGLGGAKDGEPAYAFSHDEVRVAGGETCEARCGGPLALTLQVQQQPSAPGSTDLRVTFLVKTEAGHTFSARDRSKDAPAKLAVLNAAGQVIARGSGQYG